MNSKILLSAFLITTIFFSAAFAAVPAITLVSTAHADGAFKQGELISIDITFSETVDVNTTNGTPALALNSGGTAAYAAGSGSAILSFNYTANNGENSAGLDYAATDSLALNGATIQNAGLENTDNTLPAVGTFAAAHAIVIDTVAPTTTDDYAAKDNAWQSSSQTISLTPADTTSGIATTNYCTDVTNTCDSAAGTAYTVPVLISMEDTSYFRYASTDNAGNIETTVSRTVKIDTVAPSSLSVSINDGNSQAGEKAVVLTLAATGATECQFKNDGETYSAFEAFAATKAWNLKDEDGNRSVYFQCKDAAGNLSAETIDSIDLNKTAPSSLSISINSGATYTNSRTVTLTLSAVDAAQCRFKNDSDSYSAWETYATTKTWTLTDTDGTRTVYYQCKSVAGALSSEVSDNISLDRAAPSVSIGAPSSSGHTVTIGWSGSDNGPSGIYSYYLFRGDSQIYSGTETSYSFTESDGTYSYKIKARDNAGNESAFSESGSITLSSTTITNNNTSSSNTNPNKSVWIDLNINAPDFAKTGKINIGIVGDEVFAQGYQIKVQKTGSLEIENIASASSFSGKSVNVNYEIKSGVDGNITIIAVAWSSTGYRAEKQKTIVIDNKAPSIELLAPKANEILSKTVELKARALDDKAGVKQVAFYYKKASSTEWQAIGVGTKLDKNSWILNWNTVSLDDASYEIKATAMDNAANTTDSIVTVKVSNITGLGIKGTASVESQASIDYNNEEAARMFEALLKTSLAEKAKASLSDNNVFRTLKIIKIVDGNNVSYKVSVFLQFRNSSGNEESIQLVEVIPKEIAQSAAEIESNSEFTIIENDPVIAWNLSNIRPGKSIEIVYSLKGTMTKETAMRLIDENTIQKYLAPPIIVSSENKIDRQSFIASVGTTGLFGLGNTGLIAIIVGIIVVALIIGAVYYKRDELFAPKETGTGATAKDWSYNESAHKGIADKINNSLNEFMGSSNNNAQGKKWVLKKEDIKTIATEKKPGFSGLFKGLDFTIAKKPEKPKTEGKGKWSSIDNSDI